MKKLTVRLDEDDYNLLVEQCKVLECTQNQFFRELLRKNLATDIEEYNTTTVGTVKKGYRAIQSKADETS